MGRTCERRKGRMVGRAGFQDLKTRKSSFKNSRSSSRDVVRRWERRVGHTAGTIGRSGSGSQDYHDGCEEQEQVHGLGRDQGDGGRGSKTQEPGEDEVVMEKGPYGSQRVRRGQGGLAQWQGGLVTKLWVNGLASEDRDEWTEEVKAHCDRCYDDKMGTPEVQAETVLYERNRGDILITLQGRRKRISVDRGDVEVEGQRACQLLGDRDAAMFTKGDCARGHALVRETVQGRVPCSRGVGNSSPGVSQKSLMLSWRPGCAGSVRSHC